MDWLQRMNEALGYIEANLDGEIDLGEAGRLAGCSGYHFQRVFSFMANTTLAEYIRRRRLTRAAFDLQSGRETVLAVALRYGYDSPTSFARAFAALHGVSPSAAKASGASLVAYPALSFQITVQGVYAMNYRIETKDPFRVVGKSLATTMENDQALRDIPQFWQKMGEERLIERLCGLMDTEPKGIFGLGQGGLSDGAATRYTIGAASTQPAPPDMEALRVPAATWAIFESVGPLPATLQDLQRRIYTEWLPTSGYEYNAAAPDIELYSDGDQQAKDYTCWVWLPVVKKA